MIPAIRFGTASIMPPRQRDLFGHESPDIAGDDFETPEYHADPDKVREELRRILAEAKGAQSMPWDRQRAALYQTIFPQMTNWLPEDEGAQLRFEFEVELERLKAA
ncbi:MAG: hypothetical protein K8F62_09090 [Pseudorhodoplanes sp.]|nr:hypothetical protein [Pseudorhodoplanes sp.]